MSVETPLYDPGFLSEAEKLKHLGTTSAWLIVLIKESFAKTTSQHLTKTVYHLRDIRSLCDEAAEKENPDFIDSFFLKENKTLIAQKRMETIRRHIMHFTMAGSLVRVLANDDPALQETRFSASSGDRYTCKNVAKALVKVQNAYTLLGGEANRTTSAERILIPLPEEKGPLHLGLTTALNARFSRGGNSPLLQDIFEQNYEMMRSVCPDPSAPKINIHPALRS